MRREDIETEIQKILNTVPDDMLQDIFKILKDFADKNPDSTKLSHILNKIIKEDKRLLERFK